MNLEDLFEHREITEAELKTETNGKQYLVITTPVNCQVPIFNLGEWKRSIAEYIQDTLAYVANDICTGYALNNVKHRALVSGAAKGKNVIHLDGFAYDLLVPEPTLAGIILRVRGTNKIGLVAWPANYKLLGE